MGGGGGKFIRPDTGGNGILELFFG